MFDEDALVADALRAGARGYLFKGAEQDEIERAIRAVAQGDVIFTQAVAARVLGQVSAEPPTPGRTVALPPALRMRPMIDSRTPRRSAATSATSKPGPRSRTYTSTTSAVPSM